MASAARDQLFSGVEGVDVGAEIGRIGGAGIGDVNYGIANVQVGGVADLEEVIVAGLGKDDAVIEGHILNQAGVDGGHVDRTLQDSRSVVHTEGSIAQVRNEEIGAIESDAG